MVWYSEIPARRARQILGDLWLVAWTALWIWAGIRLHDLVMNLATPALTIAEGAEDLSLSIDEAGAAVAAVPLIGEAMRSWAVIWVPMRVIFIRRATAARHFVDANDDLDLFALRAMARQPLHVLARITDDPAGAWRRGDRDVITALATLELRDEGLQPPAPN